MKTKDGDFVCARAGFRCEYCRLRQKHSPLVLQIEHSIPKKHGGGDDVDNLCVACDRCNLHKSSNLTGIDPETKQVVPLFNPRTDQWNEHFFVAEVEIQGATPI